MADKKISELTNITGANLADTDEFVVVDASANETKAITYDELKKFNGTVTANTLIADNGTFDNRGVLASHQNNINQSYIGAYSGANAGLATRIRFGYNDGVTSEAAENINFVTATVERMRIDSSGNVGIGTVSPSELLDVNGDAKINDVVVGRGGGNNNSNTALGRIALSSNVTGTLNTAVGNSALQNNTGTANTAVGSGALLNSTTGVNNVALGTSALNANTTGSQNIAIGRLALSSNTTTSNSTAVGFQSLYLSTGESNTAIGHTSGDAITTGARNVIVGAFSDISAVTGVDQVVVGYSLTGKGNDTAFIGGTGGAYNEKNVTTWETTSDERIKKNIVDNNDGLSVLSQIQVRNFEYRTPEEITDLPSHAAIKQEGVQLGVIAQELQQVLPECVSENSTGVLSVNTDPLVWYLINAVKELKAEIEQLKGN